MIVLKKRLRTTRKRKMILPEYLSYYVKLIKMPNSRSNEFSDELVWAASWLYRATDDSRYRIEAETLFNEYSLNSTSGFSWDGKISGADVCKTAKKLVMLVNNI